MRKVATSSVDDQMAMVIHETGGQYRRIKPFHHLPDHAHEGMAVLVMLKNGLTTVTA